jgi:hypothetical protein
MMDYRIHGAALDAFREQLALASFNDPAIRDRRDQDVADADQEPALALLGSLIDQLIGHASSDGWELDTLEEAADLWTAGLDLFDALTAFRSRLEAVLIDPTDPAALHALETAQATLRPLVRQVFDQQSDLAALRSKVTTMRHLPRHPRQEDAPLAAWPWGDVFLARRTEAFVREVRRQATEPKASAFAFGVLSCYGSNAVGSSFVGQVVGGPRRAHRYRHRLARNTLGSWAAAHDPFTPSLPTMTQVLDQAFPQGLPQDISNLVRSAITATFETGQLAALPDLDLGYQRLVRHLRLLSRFRAPDPPAPPQEPFLTRLFGDPADPYSPSMPETTGLVEAGVAPGVGAPGGVMPLSMGTDDGPTTSQSPDSTEVQCGSFWEALGWSIVFLIGGWFACVIRWSDGDRCELWDNITQNWEEAFPGGASVAVETESGALTTQAATNIAAQVDQVTKLVGDLFNLETLMWDGLQKAKDFLALFGLIYPDGLLDRWRYAQYASVPATANLGWPRLPDGGNRFDEYPTTGIEHPAAAAIAFPPGLSPAAVLARVPQAGVVSAADVSIWVWEQMARGVQDSTNLDLDGDRGWRHPCWRVVGSIADQPVDVAILQYDET